MYRLFLVLKDRDEPPTEDEIAIASRKKTLDPMKAAEYLVKLEKASATLVDALAKQNQQGAVNSFFFFFFSLCLIHNLLTKYYRKLIGIRRHLSSSFLNGWLHHDRASVTQW